MDKETLYKAVEVVKMIAIGIYGEPQVHNYIDKMNPKTKKEGAWCNNCNKWAWEAPIKYCNKSYKEEIIKLID